MTGVGRTHVYSTHPFRRTARTKERELQKILDLAWSASDPQREQMFREVGLPEWAWRAQGVRVEKAGPFNWAVVITETGS